MEEEAALEQAEEDYDQQPLRQQVQRNCLPPFSVSVCHPPPSPLLLKFWWDLFFVFGPNQIDRGHGNPDQQLNVGGGVVFGL
jgi:hypothetical protein